MIREGMMVEVIHGPLKGVVGRLMRKDDKARLVLSVDLIGQAVSVEVDAADVGPTKSRSRTAAGTRVADSMKIGNVTLPSPFVVAPMAGMTDTAFRRLVKRHGGCGLVVTEMVSSEGLVRGIDRTLEYAEYTEEERPVSIQIFGGDPEKMAAAAQIVEGMGADIVDVNMGCPVPKIAKHNAGCSLMREPEHAATVINAMAKAVKIPVTVKMRAGWNDTTRNAPELARRVAGRRRRRGHDSRTHGRAVIQRLGGLGSGGAVWREHSTIPVLGSGDCIEPQQIVDRMRIRRQRRARRPRRAAQSVDPRAGGRPGRRPSPRDVTLRGARSVPARLHRAARQRARGRSRRIPARRAGRRMCRRHAARRPRGRERWVINKVRALMLVVFERARRRLPLASPRQRRRQPAAAARDHRRILLRGAHERRHGRPVRLT